MTVVFDPLAQAEFEDARAYYGVQAPGVAEAFRQAVWAAIAIIERHPRLGCALRCGLRRVLVKGFPYKLIYLIEDHQIVIMAVAHGHRRPDYWIDRLA